MGIMLTITLHALRIICTSTMVLVALVTAVALVTEPWPIALACAGAGFAAFWFVCDMWRDRIGN